VAASAAAAEITCEPAVTEVVTAWAAVDLAEAAEADIAEAEADVAAAAGDNQNFKPRKTK
jgi:hypothetical protein